MEIADLPSVISCDPSNLKTKPIWWLHIGLSLNLVYVFDFHGYLAVIVMLSTKCCIQTGCLPRNAYMRHVSLCSNCLHKEHWLNLVAFLLLINYVHPELCSWKAALKKEGGGRQGQWVWSLALNMRRCLMEGSVGLRLSLYQNDAWNLKLSSVLLLTTVAVSFL